MKIVVLNPIKNIVGEQFVNQLKPFGKVVVKTEIQPLEEISELFDTEEKVLAIDPDFTGWKLPNEVIAKIPNLKAIVISSTSFEWIDIDFCKNLGIKFLNTKNFSTNAVAEWLVQAALVLSRKVPLIIKDDFQEDYGLYRGQELSGKTVGIIGLGNIGKRSAELFQGIGMNVQYWSKNSKDEQFRFSELSNLFKTSDVVVITLAKNDETKKLITDEMLKTLKQNAIVVVATKSVYNHELVLDLVKQNKIYGYGFESGAGEFNSFEGNVWAPPALAWCTDESFARNSESWLQEIKSAASL